MDKAEMLALVALKKSGTVDVSQAVAAKQAAQAAQAAAEEAQEGAEAAQEAAETAAASFTVDSAMSDSSTNPVQNKVIKGELDDLKSQIGDDIKGVNRQFSGWSPFGIGSSTGFPLFDQGGIRLLAMIPKGATGVHVTDEDYSFAIYAFDPALKDTKGGFKGIYNNGAYGSSVAFYQQLTASQYAGSNPEWTYYVCLKKGTGNTNPITLAEGENCVYTVAESATLSQQVQKNERTIGVESYDTKLTYQGQRINLTGYTYDVTDIGRLGIVSGQGMTEGCAAFNDRLVALNVGGTYKICKLNSHYEVCGSGSVPIGAKSDMHGNCCVFGANKYDAGDPFPLLYVTGGEVNGDQSYVAVERITGSDNNYTMSLVQIIEFDYTGFATAGLTEIYEYPNIFVEGAWLYSFGAINRTLAANNKGNKFVITRYALPTTESSTVTLDASDVYEQVICPYTADTMQGGTIHNGVIYHLFGFGATTNGTGHSTLLAIDARTGMQRAIVDLSSVSCINALEPESCTVFNGGLLVVNGGAWVCRLVF